MEMYNDKIEAGMMAMVINVSNPENSHIIGKVVMVVDIYKEGEPIGHLFVPPRKVAAISHDLAHIKGEGLGDDGRGALGNGGGRMIATRYLMPLPPLKEKTKEKEATLA